MSGDRFEGFEDAHELLHEAMGELYPEPGEAHARLADLEAQEAFESFETGAAISDGPPQRDRALRHLVALSSPFALVELGGLGTYSKSVFRSIVAVDVERSTSRPNPVKAEIRRTLYDLLDRALQEAGYGSEHLEPVTDRGNGVLILIRPVDGAPRNRVLDRFIPTLTALLSEHNAAVRQPLRLRCAFHAGEVQFDGSGFSGNDLNVAIRLLEARKLKWALGEASESPLALVVSEEIFSGVVRQSNADPAPYEPLVRVRVGNKTHLGWVHIPASKGFHRQTRPRRRGGKPHH
jgi:hypothetical protein